MALSEWDQPGNESERGLLILARLFVFLPFFLPHAGILLFDASEATRSNNLMIAPKVTSPSKMLRSYYLVVVDKMMQYDLVNVSRFAPGIVILEIGTNDLCNAQPETVGSQIDELV